MPLDFYLLKDPVQGFVSLPVSHIFQPVSQLGLPGCPLGSKFVFAASELSAADPSTWHESMAIFGWVVPKGLGYFLL